MNIQVLSLLSSGRVFGIDQQTLIQIGIQLFNTGLLAFVLSRLLYKPVVNFLKKRTDRIQAQMEQIDSEMVKANELKLEYEKRLTEIDNERSEIIGEARKNATERSKQLLAEAKNEAEAMKTRAENEIHMEQERIKDEVRQSIIDVSSAMTAKLVTQIVEKEKQDKLISESLQQLEEMTWRN